MDTTNQIDYDPKESLTNMILKNFMWGIVGIVLGILINVALESGILEIVGKYQIEVRLMLQLMICSIVLAFIHVKINNKFGWSWQNITPGLFFVSYFFGTQFATFSNIQEINNKLYNLIDPKLM